jgi:hypothetical protein
MTCLSCCFDQVAFFGAQEEYFWSTTGVMNFSSGSGLKVAYRRGPPAVWSSFSSVRLDACEKRVHGNCLILFWLVGIPTMGMGLLKS